MIDPDREGRTCIENTYNIHSLTVTTYSLKLAMETRRAV